MKITIKVRKQNGDVLPGADFDGVSSVNHFEGHTGAYLQLRHKSGVSTFPLLDDEIPEVVIIL